MSRYSVMYLSCAECRYPSICAAVHCVNARVAFHLDVGMCWLAAMSKQHMGCSQVLIMHNKRFLIQIQTAMQDLPTASDGNTRFDFAKTQAQPRALQQTTTQHQNSTAQHQMQDTIIYICWPVPSSAEQQLMCISKQL